MNIHNEKTRLQVHLVFRLTEHFTANPGKFTVFANIMDTLAVVHKLQAIAMRHHKLAEDYCNVPEPREGYYNEKLTELESKALALCEDVTKGLGITFGIGLDMQRDPRGSTMMLVINRCNKYPLTEL